MPVPAPTPTPPASGRTGQVLDVESAQAAELRPLQVDGGPAAGLLEIVRVVVVLFLGAADRQRLDLCQRLGVELRRIQRRFAELEMGDFRHRRVVHLGRLERRGVCRA